MSKTGLTNSFATATVTNTGDCEAVCVDDMASGNIAYKLGAAFAQKIGAYAHPVFGGDKLLYDEAGDLYYNESTVGISDIIGNESAPELYYNLQGIPSSRPWSGQLNIIRMSDGTVVKQMVK